MLSRPCKVRLLARHDGRESMAPGEAVEDVYESRGSAPKYRRRRCDSRLMSGSFALYSGRPTTGNTHPFSNRAGPAKTGSELSSQRRLTIEHHGRATSSASETGSSKGMVLRPDQNAFHTAGESS